MFSRVTVHSTKFRARGGGKGGKQRARERQRETGGGRQTETPSLVAYYNRPTSGSMAYLLKTVLM